MFRPSLSKSIYEIYQLRPRFGRPDFTTNEDTLYLEISKTTMNESRGSKYLCVEGKLHHIGYTESDTVGYLSKQYDAFNTRNGKTRDLLFISSVETQINLNQLWEYVDFIYFYDENYNPKPEITQVNISLGD